MSNLRLLSALINGVTSNPLHFLLLPSFVAFMAPTDWLWWIVPMFTLVSVILVMYGSLSSRWEQMLVFVQRWRLGEWLYDPALQPILQQRDDGWMRSSEPAVERWIRRMAPIASSASILQRAG